MTAELVGAIHIHSDYSYDGRDSLEALREFCLARGLGFLGMTDHAESFTSGRYETYLRHCAAVSDATVRLIPGLEFRFTGYPGLHLLALGLARWIAPATPEEFVVQAGAHARFTIVAHPVLARYRVPDSVLAGIDAIEVWNANYNTRYLPDTRAIRLLAESRKHRPDLVATAGLDQHDRRNDREVRVVVSAEAEDPLVALKQGRFENRGRTLRFGPRRAWGPMELTGLGAARAVLDGAEWVQERVSRTLHRWRSGS